MSTDEQARLASDHAAALQQLERVNSQIRTLVEARDGHSSRADAAEAEVSRLNIHAADLVGRIRRSLDDIRDGRLSAAAGEAEIRTALDVLGATLRGSG